MYDIQSIYQAKSVDDAIRALQADPSAIVIAGGTDVLIKIREGKLAGCSLVSIHNLTDELSGVTLSPGGDVEIGPLTTFRGVTFSDVIRQTVPVLGEAADMAGGPQLRAAGTIGGNVCNGITSADTASTLVALDAVLRVRGPKGERDVPISEWYQGVGRVALAPYELLVKIIIPRDNYAGYTGHYIKYAQRAAMDIATLGVSCLVKLTDDKKTVDDAALAFGVAGPVPMRAPSAEAAVRGLPIEEAIAVIGKAALADVNPLSPGGDVEIGPLTTFRGVTFSDVIRQTVPVLGEAADMAGGPQLRAAGTIGGNVCNGITSADTASTLVALDAVLRVRGPKGERDVPISEWYQGVGRVALAPYELLVKIIIPRDNYAGYTGHYIKYAQRAAMDIATLGVSCLVKLTDDKKTVDDAALAFGVAGPVPMRAPSAEAAVRGLPIEEAIAVIGKAALADVNPRTSWRASKEFRIQLIEELSPRALREAARKGGAHV